MPKKAKVNDNVPETVVKTVKEPKEKVIKDTSFEVIDKENEKPVTIEEVEEVLENVDTEIKIDDEPKEEKNFDEVEEIVNEINEINNSEKEFSKNIEEAETKEDVENIINIEIKKVEAEKEKVEKIIKRSRREQTSSWNGINWDF